MVTRAVLTALVVAGCATPVPDSPVEGIVTDVQVASLTEVEAFSLELDSGDTLVFAVDAGNPDVPASELREHLNFAIRLKVSFHPEGEELVADAVEHGSGPEAPSSP